MSPSTHRGIAIGALVLAIVLLAIDNLIDLLIDEKPAIVRFVLLSLLCIAAAAAIFLFALPTAQRASGETNRLSLFGFAIGLLALAAIIVFFTGLPIVLGAGAFVLGRLGEQRAEEREREAEKSDSAADQPPAAEPSGVSAGERASQGWAAAVMGGLAALVGVVLFLIEFVRT